MDVVTTQYHCCHEKKAWQERGVIWLLHRYNGGCSGECKADGNKPFPKKLSDMAGKLAETIPQVCLDNVQIGGYTEFAAFASTL